MPPIKLVLIVCCLWVGQLSAQRQYSDTTYLPPAFVSAYSSGEGPAVYIDEAHNNFHTREGRYAPFAKVLELDGFRVLSSTAEFSRDQLAEMDILVIANAIPESSLGRWVAPTASAFSEEEIEAVHQWVADGGRLFLLADHMPMAGAAAELAASFGYQFHDSFAEDTLSSSGTMTFSLADGSLSHFALGQSVEGRLAVDSVSTFTGQAFPLPEGAHSVLDCGPSWVVRMPEVAWQFPEGTPWLSASGWSQLAYQNYGKGKLIISGEAAMFSAQIAEVQDRRFKAGMNSERGRFNYRLLLNLMRWLAE